MEGATSGSRWTGVRRSHNADDRILPVDWKLLVTIPHAPTPATADQVARDVHGLGPVRTGRLLDKYVCYRRCEHSAPLLYAAIGWEREYIDDPELQRFSNVEFMATVHPWITAGLDPDGDRRHHIPPDFERTKEYMSHIPPDWSGWIYIDAEPWRSEMPDESTYQWRWKEMHEYYGELIEQFRRLFPDAKLVVHHLVGASIQYAEGESDAVEKILPIARLVDAITVNGYSSNVRHAENGGMNLLRRRIDRAEELRELTDLPIMVIHSIRIAGDHDPIVYWSDEALRMRADEIEKRGHSILLWSGAVGEQSLRTLNVLKGSNN